MTWRLVPEELTADMRNAFHAVTDDDVTKSGAAGARWAAMLAAAPALSAMQIINPDAVLPENLDDLQPGAIFVKRPEEPVNDRLRTALQTAVDRLADMLKGDDGQAWDEARKALPQLHAELSIAEALPDGASQAVETLRRLGYTYHGGELWKPPLGVPRFLPDPGSDVEASIRALREARAAEPAGYLVNHEGCDDLNLKGAYWRRVPSADDLAFWQRLGIPPAIVKALKPAQDDHIDVVLAALEKARADVARLDSGRIELVGRDSWGEETRVLHCGVDLRAAIDAAQPDPAPGPDLFTGGA